MEKIKMTTEVKIPVLKSIKDLADFIVIFWVEISSKISFFKEKNDIADIANMIVFIDAHKKENTKIFSEEEIALAKTLCFKYLQDSLARYGFDICSESYGMGDFFEQVFGDKIHSREFRIPELFMRHFDFKGYANHLDEERVGGPKKRNEMLQNYPGGSVLCIRERGSYWKIIASVQE